MKYTMVCLKNNIFMLKKNFKIPGCHPSAPWDINRSCWKVYLQVELAIFLAPGSRCIPILLLHRSSVLLPRFYSHRLVRYINHIL